MSLGKNILETVIDHDSGKNLQMAADAFRMAQGLLQRPTTSPKVEPEKQIEEEEVTIETLPEIAPKAEVKLPPLQESDEAVTTPVTIESSKIIKKDLTNEKIGTEPIGSTVDGTSSKKVETDYSISKYNNPGNIEQGIQWEGLGEGGYGPNERFAIFNTPEAGIRALRKDLTTKLNRFDGNLRKMIEQYAPESENDVEQYLKVVEQTAGVKDVYTEEDMDNITKGFIRMENKKELADKYISLMEK